ncbi:hypothetical protein [Pseudomonas mangiferae]|uniref:Uncharacterized protein n=1 Tax=Pseudomonas mangiferae TaxID=2593654 RepID=A0A553H0T4_9PSED|nr:hypothetical protein [Pseudomonas mangiferae]TRX75348.1 hypothetical protein FM069_06275 [Pseudomonas mangiferae]
MASTGIVLDAAAAFAYVGQTVLVELAWDEEPEGYWMCLHIVGVVLPMSGVYEDAYFLTLNMNGQDRYPNEVFFSHIRTIRTMRYRDRQSTGNVLGRMLLPSLPGSGAALPARRNGHVPANGSTGEAHP